MGDTGAAAVAGTSVQELIGGYREARIPRRALVASLTAAGMSATAVALLVNVAERSTPPSQTLAQQLDARRQALGHAVTDPAQAHARHVSRQVAGTRADGPAERTAAVSAIVDEYAPDAVVNDPLFGAPLVGTAAIAVHKTAEMAAMSDVTLNILSRTAVGEQLVSTWEMQGTHSGPFYGLQPTGRRVETRGVTVHTRGRDGKIVNETLYYDAADMHRQLAGR